MQLEAIATGFDTSDGRIECRLNGNSGAKRNNGTIRVMHEPENPRYLDFYRSLKKGEVFLINIPKFVFEGNYPIRWANAALNGRSSNGCYYSDWHEFEGAIQRKYGSVMIERKRQRMERQHTTRFK